MEAAGDWAPEIQPLRSGAAKTLAMNKHRVPPERIAKVVGKELQNDPYSVDLLVTQMLAQANMGNQEEANRLGAFLATFAKATVYVRSN